MDEERLLESGGHALEREILRAGAEEVAPAAARRRALMTLGLLAVAPTAAASVGATTGSTAARAGLKWLPKWGWALSVGGAAAVVGAIAVQQAGQPATLAPPVSSSSARRAMPAPNARPAVIPSAPDDTPPLERSSPAPTSSAALGTPNSTTRSISIRDEIKLLDRARAALAGGTPDKALALLREYSARHPGGELSREASVIREQATRAQRQAQPGAP